MLTPDTQTYLFGGTGMNIGQILETYKLEDYMVKSNFSYLDTAVSNVESCVPYLVPDTDGTGADHKKAFQVLEPHVTPFLEQFKPGKFNILITSLTGGTGSVATQLVARALAKRKLPFVIVAVGNAITADSTKNTINCLLGLNLAAKKAGAVFPIMYFENRNEPEEGSLNTGIIPVVNDMVVEAVKNLYVLFSGKNKNLDSEDIINFLNYTKKSKTSPQLCDVLYAEANTERSKAYASKVISTVALLGDTTESEPSLNQAYGTVGYYPDDAPDELVSTVFMTTIELANGRLLALTDRKKELQTIEDDRTQRQVEEQKIFSALEEAVDEDSGFIFD